MVWSVISVFGTGRLYIVEGTMRQDQYITVLRNKLIPQLRARAHEQGSQGIGGFIFMHDGAPCHRGRRVTEFLEDQGIETLPWPGNSPDMNPIENLWAILKKDMKKEKITTKTDLISALIRSWHRNVDINNSCRNLVHSMPDRVKALKTARGWFTEY